MNIIEMLHVLAVVIWVGGMFFAFMALRPASAKYLTPEPRLRIWAGVFTCFFPYVWSAIIVILLSGLYMINEYSDSWFDLSLHVTVMTVIGIMMMMIFMYIFFVPFQRLKRAVGAEDWATAGDILAHTRIFVGTNMTLGLINIVLAYVLA